MKHIRKNSCPHNYSNWVHSVSGTGKARWDEVPTAMKRSLLGTLNSEQGWLCAYTMRRIECTTSHIEHIKPQSRCRADLPGSDLDYRNLVACFPADGMRKHFRYGAQKKGSWWERNGAAFVSPLHAHCERRFLFDIAGGVSAVNDNSAAMTTIVVLGLAHKSLAEDRKRVIAEFLYGSKGSAPLSLAKAQRAFQQICNAQKGRFYEFCVAIRDALAEYIRRLSRQRTGTRRTR